jgi:hypothetical protein
VTTLARSEAVNEVVPTYLNRLSDLLFVLARITNQADRAGDVIWSGLRQVQRGLGDEVGDNRVGRGWTCTDTGGSFPHVGYGCSAGQPTMIVRSGRRGRRFESGHPDQR